MLIAQSNDNSNPKPQIGKFLSPEQHSVCSSETVKQIQMGARTSFVKFSPEVDIRPEITSSEPILETRAQDQEAFRINWKCLPEV